MIGSAESCFLNVPFCYSRGEPTSDFCLSPLSTLLYWLRRLDHIEVGTGITMLKSILLCRFELPFDDAISFDYASIFGSLTVSDSIEDKPLVSVNWVTRALNNWAFWWSCSSGILLFSACLASLWPNLDLLICWLAIYSSSQAQLRSTAGALASAGTV